MTTAALIVAAGTGARFGASQPKQFLQLAGRAVLRHSLDSFLAHPEIDLVQIVVHPASQDDYARAIDGLCDHQRLLPPVDGGATRQDSVHLGLQALENRGIQKVLIHDAARPCLSRELIDTILRGLDSHPAVLPALPVTDTLKRCDDLEVLETLPRDGLFRAQTPQAFHFKAILKAHAAAANGPELTDDVAVAEAAGVPVIRVAGEEDNIKITHPADLPRAAAILGHAEEYAKMITIAGSGFDVHAFDAGDHVTICGVEIPHSHGLSGHSDADVGLHALTDAILGAIAEGDIGMHFPPSDPRWKGANSRQFLQHAIKLARKKSARVVHVDVTIICEAPKMGPHRDAMRQVMAELLELPLARVSVKATTTEKLGFTGRREGIAAQAIATLSVPELETDT